MSTLMAQFAPLQMVSIPMPFRSATELKKVYWTARGSQTGIDWREITEKQLKEWEAKHHELSLNKPHYDLYVDDKTINSYDYFKD